MWEWRIFLASADLDVFSLLNKRNPWFETSRTDVYVSATRDVGVKWRGGGLLEVKLKTDQAADQRSELWSKVLAQSVSLPSTDDEIKQVVLNTLAKLSSNIHNKQILTEAIQVLQDASSLKFYKIEKKRKNSSFQNCAIEQTALIISDKQYITIAIEGDRPVDIVRVLQTHVTYNGQLQSLEDVLTDQLGASPQGYPEFVTKLAE